MLFRNWSVRIGGIALLLLVLISMAAPWLGTVDPSLFDAGSRDLRPGQVRLEGCELFLPPERGGPGGHQPERVQLSRLQAGRRDLHGVHRAHRVHGDRRVRRVSAASRRGQEKVPGPAGLTERRQVGGAVAGRNGR